MVKVNIISGFLGAGKTTLIKKLLGGSLKDEKVILLIQGEGWGNWNYLNSRVNAELRPSYAKIGQYASVWPSYQSAWATSNYTASAENPEPLSVPKANGQPSGGFIRSTGCPEIGTSRSIFSAFSCGIDLINPFVYSCPG